MAAQVPGRLDLWVWQLPGAHLPLEKQALDDQRVKAAVLGDLLAAGIRPVAETSPRPTTAQLAAE